MSPQADGHVLAGHSSGRYETWQPFVEATGEVTVFARTGTHSKGVRADGEGIHFFFSPNYDSFKSFFRFLPEILWRIYKVGKGNCIFFLRIPEPLSILAGLICIILRRPYIANLVSDPASSLSTAKIGRILHRLSKIIVAHATAAVFVSSHLRRGYPIRSGRPSITRSNVALSSSDFTLPRAGLTHSPVKLVMVGSNQSFGKGQDIALAALEILNRTGNYRLTFVGGGKIIDSLIDRARKVGMSEFVRFTGEIHDREQLREILDEHDVFVLPSRAEGLPRAMIEAMARGIPCVASRVGGIPDVLPSRLLMPEYTAEALAETVQNLVNDTEQYCAASSDLRSKAEEISVQASPDKLKEFLNFVVDTRYDGTT